MKVLHPTLLLIGWAWLGNASAATITTGYFWMVGSTIPDNNSSGVVSTKSVEVEMATIDTVTVILEIAGGWNGDYYAYLQHSTGFSVLLNRPGRTLARPAGSGSSGMDITIDDEAAGEMHVVSASGTITGTWRPDARNVDPGVVLDTTARTATLGSFNGLDPNGSWTLYVADVAAGDQGTLTRWGIEITGQTVPEPSVPALFLGALMLPLGLRRRR